MSEQTTTVRTDELRPGDRVWHPFDIACFTVAHKPEPVALDFEGERGLRVTGTDDRGETVHVDVAPAYKWHRAPKATTPTTHDPLVVNTKDGVCWTRRTVTSGGIALYAPEPVKTYPEFVMATLPELAEHGIVGSAFALPMPVAPEPQEDPVAAGRRLDLLALMDERAASAVSPVLAGVLDEAERLRASRWDATKVVAQMESKLLAMHGELTRATERVAELEAERHSTNESLSEAAEQLRVNRDRITELETEREKLVRWHGEDSEAITKLVARVERHRARLVALQNDALAMRGSLSPNGEDRKVPFPLGETLTPAVDWLINRVTELEAAAVEGRAALAAFCHDHQDPGTAALGALYLLQQATPGTPMEPGETVPKVYRASHDAIVMGLYTTAAAARAHCEAEERRSWGETSAPTNFDWIEDEEDGVAEMTAFVGGEERTTGYVVTPLEVAAAYDPDGDE